MVVPENLVGESGNQRRLPLPYRTTTFRLAFLAEPIRICLIGPTQLNGGPVAGVRIRDAYPPSQLDERETVLQYHH